MKKYLILSVLVFITTNSFAQQDTDAMTKLKNVKELFDLGLISQQEYDSVSKNLTQIIL